uniref:Uncharacterized protein n=1 Tax=Lactuca sativa TaxID=4236 RepID=A0A9R1XLL2_LACSA|nr:hypothetical protein LSAT_V11C300153420 [Lactuca sativa]
MSNVQKQFSLHHKNPYPAISTTQKPVSIPKSLNQLHAKIALEAIPSTKEKEATKKPTTQKFAKLWHSLVSYTEVHYLMGFYPINYSNSERTPEALKVIETFEQPFKKFSHQLAELSNDLKKQLCKHIMKLLQSYDCNTTNICLHFRPLDYGGSYTLC